MVWFTKPHTTLLKNSKNVNVRIEGSVIRTIVLSSAKKIICVYTPYLTCDNSFNFVFLNVFLQLLMKHFLVSEVSLRMHNKTAMHVKAGFLSRCRSSRFVVRDGGLSNTDSSLKYKHKWYKTNCYLFLSDHRLWDSLVWVLRSTAASKPFHVSDTGPLSKPLSPQLLCYFVSLCLTSLLPHVNLLDTGGSCVCVCVWL